MGHLSEADFFGLNEGDSVRVNDRFSGRAVWYDAIVSSPPEESQRPIMTCEVTDSRWKRDRDQYYSLGEIGMVRLPDKKV